MLIKCHLFLILFSINMLFTMKYANGNVKIVVANVLNETNFISCSSLWSARISEQTTVSRNDEYPFLVCFMVKSCSSAIKYFLLRAPYHHAFGLKPH